MPVIPYGVTKNKPYYKKQVFTPKQKKEVRKIATSVHKQAADHRMVPFQLTVSTFGNSTHHAWNIFHDISQGDAFNNRTGSQLNVSGVLFRMRFENPNVADMTVRVRIYEDNEETFSSSVTAASVPVANQTSVGLITDTSDAMTTPNDKFSVNVLKDMYVEIPCNHYDGPNTKSNSQKHVEFYLPYKKKITFRPGSSFLSGKNLYATVTPNIVGAAVGADVGGFRVGYSIYFSE